MRKFALILAPVIVAGDARQAMAIAQFQAAFIKQYVNTHEDKEFAAYVKKEARCNICHQGKATTKNVHHNAYGKHLVELLDPKKDKANAKKIKEALDKVAKMHSDPKDEKSPTYGELIEKSQLPGGDLEESKKEPEAEKK